jgi:hypothetical protein
MARFDQSGPITKATEPGAGAPLGRFYFDQGRSRVFMATGHVYDFSWWHSKRSAILWCALENIEFIDNSLDRLAESIRRDVLLARKAASHRPEHLLAFGKCLQSVEPVDYDELWARWDTEVAELRAWGAKVTQRN